MTRVTVLMSGSRGWWPPEGEGGGHGWGFQETLGDETSFPGGKSSLDSISEVFS